MKTKNKVARTILGTFGLSLIFFTYWALAGGMVVKYGITLPMAFLIEFGTSVFVLVIVWSICNCTE